MNFYSSGFPMPKKQAAAFKILMLIILTVFQLTGFASSITLKTTALQTPIKINGTVADSLTHAKIDNGIIHVSVNKGNNSQKLQDIIIGKDGKFSFSVASKNAIILDVFCLGYKAKTLVFNIKLDTTLDLILTPAVHTLNEVKITQNSQLRLIPGGLSIEPDTKNFSAATLLSTYLNFVPGLEISPQGTISFLGKTLEVYVDGRKMVLTGSDLLAYLQGFNVKDLGKIDILTEPGAGFDAASKPIINLNIKKFTSAGLQDIVSTGLTDPNMYYLTNSLVYATPKLRLSSNIIGNHSNFSEDNYYTISSVNQPALNSSEVLNSENPQDNLNLRLGLDGKISDKAQVGFNLFGSLVRKNSPYDYAVETSSGSDAIQSNIDYYSTRFNESAYFKLDMKKGSFQTDFSNVYYKSNSVITNQLSTGNSINTNRSTNNNYYINAKQTWNFSQKIVAEAGIKYSDNNLSNTFQTVNTTNTETLTTYDEKIFAAYLQLSYSTKAFGLQLGVRAENTTSALTSRAATNFEKNLNYLDWFPNVVASFPSFIGLSGNISYNSHISRPDYDYYLPFPDNLNAGSIAYGIGNGNLLPSIANSVGINLQKLFDKDKSTIILKVSKSYINTPYESLPFVVNNAIVSVPLNTNQMQSYNAQLIINKKWDALSLTISPGYYLYYQDNTVVNYNGQNLAIGLNGTNNYYVNASVNFKAYNGYNAVVSLYYGSKQYSALGYNDATGNSHITINKSFLKERLSTSLRVDDPFNWSKSNNYQFFNGVSEYHQYKPLIRMAYLTLSYRIGGLKPTVKRYDYQDDSRLKQDVK